MTSHADKQPKAAHSPAVDHSRVNKHGSDQASQFVDNRTEATVQRKNQVIANSHSDGVVQRMGVGAINKKHLWKKLRLEGNVRDFERVAMYTCSGATYKGDDCPFKGLTFPSPYETPPQVYLSINDISNNDDLAATMYHEVVHAFDPETPAKTDNSEEAKKKDIENEVNTWKKEIEFSIRTGGEDLNDLISDGYVVRSKEGMYIPNPEKFTPEALRDMGYGDYDTEVREERFTPGNYVFPGKTELQPFGTPEEKHQYESEIQKEQFEATHGPSSEMSDEANSMYD